MTVAMWATWIDGSPTLARFGNGADEKWGLVIPGDGSLSWEQYDGAFRSATVAPAASMQGRVPTHVAVTRAADGVSLTGYLNGRRVTQPVVPGGAPTATVPASGTIGSSNGSTVGGTAIIAGLAVWNDVLTAAEILAEYQGAEVERALVGRWPLAADYRDVGPNGLHLAPVGAPVLDLALLR
jgi:hypothetical protein